ncbi:MAG: hypothetical protein DGJ47_000648 [Rickettsiaceae bacterium]
MSKNHIFTKAFTNNLFLNKPNTMLAFGYRPFCGAVRDNYLSVRPDHKDYPSTTIDADFSELVTKSTVFVDKTKLIENIESTNCKTMLLTFPRRWGKSVNLDMLAKFHAIQTDQQGNVLEKENTDNYKLFAGGLVENKFGKDHKLPPLNIAFNSEMMQQQGQSPVIYLDLKDVPGDSYDNALNGLKRAIHKSFSKHSYLFKSNKISESDKEVVKNYINRQTFKNLDALDLYDSLVILSELLYIHHGRESKIMIDEYDSAINKAYINLFINDQELNKIVNLYRDFLSPALKNNQYLDKGIVTGVFRLAKANIFSGLNNLSNFGVGDVEFAKYYGFTQAEADEFLKAYGVDEQTSIQIKDWYNGYNIGGLEIYNPWSLVKCVSKHRYYKANNLTFVPSDILRNYWGESGNVSFITPLLKHKNIKEKIESLLDEQDGEIFCKLRKDLSVEDYDELRKIISLGSNYTVTAKGVDVLFSYLFTAGYLTSTEKNNFFTLPNKEIKSSFKDKILDYYQVEYNISEKLFHNVTDQMQLMLDANNEQDLCKNKDSFVEKLTELFTRLPKFKKINKDKLELNDGEKMLHPNEDLVHSVLNYVALQLKEITHFATEVYLGKGRADLLLVDENKKKSMIVELKYNQKDADGAIKQIYEKEYLKPIPKDFEQILLGVNINDDKNISAEVVMATTPYEDMLINTNNNNVTNYLSLNSVMTEDISTVDQQLIISGYDDSDSNEIS